MKQRGRDQTRVCADCQHYRAKWSFSTCVGVRDIVTGEYRDMYVRTARGDTNLCGPAGRLFEPIQADAKPAKVNKPVKVKERV